MINAQAQDTQTIDPYEVPPDTTIPLTLEDFDKESDVLKLTIVFKGTTADDYVPRPIDIVILDLSRAQKVQRIELAEEQGIYVRKNISTRIEEEITNPYDGQKAIMFFNPGNPGDHDDPESYENATVVLRVDYTVKNAEEESGMNIIPIMIIVLVVVIVLASLILLIMYFRRRSKDAKRFFNPEEGPYYAFRSLLDDKIYYLDPDQYANLYNSNSLDEYDYLGTSSRIGGTIMPPDDQPFMETPMTAQPMEAVPVEGGEEMVDLSSLQATPVEASTEEMPTDHNEDQVQYEDREGHSPQYEGQNLYPGVEPTPQQQTVDDLYGDRAPEPHKETIDQEDADNYTAQPEEGGESSADGENVQLDEGSRSPSN